MVREQRAKKYGKIELICFAGLLILLFVTVFFRMESDFLPILKWCIALLALGIAFYPLSNTLFGKFGDKGYLMGKAIGLLATGYFTWLLASLHIMKFSELSCMVSLVILAAVNYVVIGIFGYPKTDTRDGVGIKSLGLPLGRILIMEMLFVFILISFLYMKGFNAKAYGTEKMMDYGFMTSMFRTDYFPVDDFWFTGDNLNYYYFGQYLCTFLTKLSLNTPAYGYNLSLGTGFAFCLLFVYQIVSEIMKHFMEKKGKKKGIKVLPHVAGALSAFAVTLAGNFHYLIFGKFVPMMWEILQIPGEKPSYWFPSSTRYIGYIPDVEDKTIHEFPSYSFILGDLHAHVINITFVLVLIALLFSFVQARRIKRDFGLRIGEDWMSYIFDPKIISLGFLIGCFMMTNYWDFPIYLVVSGVVILAMNLLNSNFKKEGWLLTAVQLILIVLVAELITLPFKLNFTAMENGIGFTDKHTQFYQLMILWAFPVIVLIGFVVSLIAKYFRQKKSELTAFETPDQFDADDVVAKRGGLVGFFGKLEDSNLFILILGVCAVGLIIMPEIIYVKDIYGDAYQRANTMFKLTYQAFIMLGIMLGYVITKFVCLKETKAQQRFGIVAFVILVLLLGYFPTSCQAWFTDMKDDSLYSGLRADTYIYNEQPTDAAGIDWLNSNAKDGEVVLEAAGSSYTIYDRVSTLTGLSTVCGWSTHEWLWHNDYTQVSARQSDVLTMYTSQNVEEVKELLKKYNVDYIFIGSCEYEAYTGSGMNVNTLLSLGDIVYQGYPDINNHIIYIVKVSE